jgi:hypothetical protein
MLENLSESRIFNDSVSTSGVIYLKIYVSINCRLCCITMLHQLQRLSNTECYDNVIKFGGDESVEEAIAVSCCYLGLLFEHTDITPQSQQSVSRRDSNQAYSDCKVESPTFEPIFSIYSKGRQEAKCSILKRSFISNLQRSLDLNIEIRAI